MHYEVMNTQASEYVCQLIAEDSVQEIALWKKT